MDNDDEEARFRTHMDSLATSQSNSGKSVSMTPEKFDAIVQYLKNPDVGAPEDEWTANGQVRYWIKSRGFCLQSFPEEGLEDVLMAPAKKKGDLLQAHYYGVTRGYVQEFCSLCPVCRPHKRRPAGNVVSQILRQSAAQRHPPHGLHSLGSAFQPVQSAEVNSAVELITHHQQDVLRGHRSGPKPLQSAEVNSAVEIIEVGESSDSDEQAQPGISTVTDSLTSGLLDNETRLFRGKRGGRRFSEYGRRDKMVSDAGISFEASAHQDINVLQTLVRNKEKDHEFISGEKSVTRTLQKRSEDTRTRTVVKGDNVYIVTVNDDSDVEGEPLCEGSEDNDDASADAATAVVAPVKSMKEPVQDHVDSGANPPCSAYMPVSSSSSTAKNIMKEVAGSKNQHQVETFHTSHTTAPSQSEDAHDQENSKTQRSFPISEDSDLDADSVHCPLDPALIKLERVDGDYSELQTYSEHTAGDFHSEHGDDHPSTLSQSQFCDFSPKKCLVKNFTDHQTRTKKISARGRSSAKDSPEFIAVKSEPQEDQGNTLSGNRDVGSPVCPDWVTPAGVSPQAEDPPVAKKIKKDAHTQDDTAKQVTSSQFFQHLHVDIIDMTHCPHGYFRFICHVTDHVSKLHVLFPLQQASASDIAPALDQHVLTYYGMPKFLHSNQGHEFVEELIETLKETMEGGVVSLNGEDAGRKAVAGRGGGTNVVEELIAMLRVERCSNSAGKEGVPWKSWLPGIMRSLNRDWYAALRTCTPVAAGRWSVV